MSILARTLILLTISNIFMLCAWYLHLKYLKNSAWYIAAALSWCIAFFEYSVHIPANRIGSEAFSLSELQILQVGMSLLLFIPFSIILMGKQIKLDYLWAMLCLIGAAYFIFKDKFSFGSLFS